LYGFCNVHASWNDSGKEMLTPDTKDLVLAWQDGLPLDDTEIVENLMREIQVGIKSKLTAIKERSEIDEADAQKELDQIDAEQTQSAEIDRTRTAITLS